MAAVNGPVEAQRRDENAFEALVDVIVRPAAGVGGEIPDMFRLQDSPFSCASLQEPERGSSSPSYRLPLDSSSL